MKPIPIYTIEEIHDDICIDYGTGGYHKFKIEEKFIAVDDLLKWIDENSYESNERDAIRDLKQVLMEKKK